MKTFNSKVDTWLIVMLCVFIAALFGSLMVAENTVGYANFAGITMIFLLLIILPVWMFVSTKYVVDNEVLRIQCGPFSWVVKISEIISVTETRNPISSPALSLDRLELKFATRRPLLVSPKDKQRFCAAIGHPTIECGNL